MILRNRLLALCVAGFLSQILLSCFGSSEKKQEEAVNPEGGNSENNAQPGSEDAEEEEEEDDDEAAPMPTNQGQPAQTPAQNGGNTQPPPNQSGVSPPPPAANAEPAPTSTVPEAGRVVRYVRQDGIKAFSSQDDKSEAKASYKQGDPLVVLIQGDWAQITDGYFIKTAELSEKLVPRKKSSQTWRGR
ncbi:MAG: hypothetical protein KA436_09915 [Oligoflexales bacterium]|nr:hypothetical protein [Oligoflexales bacterium]